MKLSDKLLTFYLHQAFVFGLTEPSDAFHYLKECLCIGVSRHHAQPLSVRMEALSYCVDLVSLYCWYQCSFPEFTASFVQFVDSCPNLDPNWELPF